MVYKNLPKIGGGWSHLPQWEFAATPNMGSRYGLPIRTVWIHRWASPTPTTHREFEGVIHFFQSPHSEASSHFVFPGHAGPDRIVQMVPRARKAWTEAKFNTTGISIECGDDIWLGRDPNGFAQLARVTAHELWHAGLPPVWAHPQRFVSRRGCSRHADGGAEAGGHTQCPTTDLELWDQFVRRTQAEYARGGFKKGWGRN